MHIILEVVHNVWSLSCQSNYVNITLKEKGYVIWLIVGNSECTSWSR